MDANKLRPGQFILYEGQPYRVVDAMRRQQPRLAAKIITKLVNILTGGTVEKTYTSGENIKEADVTRVASQYIYNDGSNYVFMDLQTMEQFELSPDKLGDAVKYLIESTELSVVKFNDTPIGVEMPLSMTLTIKETEPSVKGDSVTNIMKSATLETGHKIQVPLFISEGEKILINTETGEYKGRAS